MTSHVTAGLARATLSGTLRWRRRRGNPGQDASRGAAPQAAPAALGTPHSWRDTEPPGAAILLLLRRRPSPRAAAAAAAAAAARPPRVALPPPFGPSRPSAPAAPEENKRASERGAPGPSRPGLLTVAGLSPPSSASTSSPPPTANQVEAPSGGGRPETRSEFQLSPPLPPPRPECEEKGPARPASCVRRNRAGPRAVWGLVRAAGCVKTGARSGPAEGERRGGAWSGPAGA